MKNKPAHLINTVVALQKSGEHEQAISTIGAALADTPGVSTLLLARALSLLKLGRDAEAQQSIDLATAQPSHNNTLDERHYVQLMQHYTAQKKHAQALTLANAALNILPAGAEISLQKGKAHEKLGQGTDALTCYDRTISLQPGNTAAHLARINLIGRDPARVEEALALAVAHLPMAKLELRHALSLQVAKLQIRQGNFVQAAETYRQLLAAQPTLKEAHMGLIGACERARAGEPALEAIAQAEAALGSDKALKIAKAKALTLLGRAAEASDIYKSLLDTHKPDMAVLHSLVQSLTNQKKLTEALGFIKLGIEHQSDDWRLLIAGARNSQRLGDHDTACHYYQLALSLQPTEAARITELEKLGANLKPGKQPESSAGSALQAAAPPPLSKPAGLTISISDLNPRTQLGARDGKQAATAGKSKSKAGGLRGFIRKLF